MGEPNLGSWLAADDDPDEAPAPDAPEPEPGRSSRRLWLLATAPWVAVLAMFGLWQPWQDGPAGNDLPIDAAADEEPHAAPTPGADPLPDVDADDSQGTAPSRTHAERGLDPARSQTDRRRMAVATATVRMAVERASDDRPRYVDHAAAESVDAFDGFAVVRVLAVVMDAEDEETWGQPTLRRYGVAVVDDPEDPWALGSPWALPPPPSASGASEGTEIDDPTTLEAVAEAVAAAGYADARVGKVARDPALPLLRAEITAVAPQEESAHAHEVWLSSDDPRRLLGADPSGPGPDTGPTDAPAEDPPAMDEPDADEPGAADEPAPESPDHDTE